MGLHATGLRRVSHGRVTRRACCAPFGPVTMAMALVLAFAPCLRAQETRPTDYDVKAAYLYNFGRFIEWPAQSSASQGDSFNVCVLGRDPFGPTLDTTLAGETIAGKSVVARRVSTPQEAANCRILFIGTTETGQLNKIIEALDKEAVLTVSDMPQFSQHGGMIQFVLEGKRVRFEVNLAAAQRVGLTLSSELLKVATTVRRNPATGG